MKSLKTLMLAGLGAVSLSKERAKKVVNELVKQGELKEQEARRTVEALMKRAESVRKEAEKSVHGHVESSLKKLNVASVEQLRKMEKRIQELEKALAKKSGPAKAARKKSSKTGAAKPQGAR